MFATKCLSYILASPTLACIETERIEQDSDADWAGTSSTLCYVDQFLLRSECRGQGTVALSSGESELYALGQLIHARADSSTNKEQVAR